MKKESWKSEVMSSLRGITRAEPNPFLFTRIEARLAKEDAIIPVRKLSLVFSGIALLFVLNFLVVMNSGKSSQKSFNREYSLSNFNYQLY